LPPLAIKINCTPPDKIKVPDKVLNALLDALLDAVFDARRALPLPAGQL
jgi:hypothetical protein